MAQNGPAEEPRKTSQNPQIGTANVPPPVKAAVLPKPGEQLSGPALKEAGLKIADSMIDLASKAKPIDVEKVIDRELKPNPKFTNSETLAINKDKTKLVVQHIHSAAGKPDHYLARLYELKEGNKWQPAASFSEDAAHKIFDSLQAKVKLNDQVVAERTKELVTDLTGPRTQIGKIEWKETVPEQTPGQDGDLRVNPKHAIEYRAYHNGINIRAVAALGPRGIDDPASQFQVRINQSYVSGDQAKDLFNAINAAAKTKDKPASK